MIRHANFASHSSLLCTDPSTTHQKCSCSGTGHINGFYHPGELHIQPCRIFWKICGIGTPIRTRTRCSVEWVGLYKGGHSTSLLPCIILPVQLHINSKGGYSGQVTLRSYHLTLNVTCVLLQL